MSYPDNANFFLMDRSQASRRYRLDEILSLNNIEKAEKAISEAMGLDSYVDAALKDALSSLRAAREQIEDGY